LVGGGTPTKGKSLCFWLLGLGLGWES